MAANYCKSLLLLFALFGLASAALNLRACPLLGQQYPAPVELSNNSEFKLATKQIEAALKTYNLQKTSLSIAMFSPSEEGLLYQFHHTDALLANSSEGARKVDANSIYRIASISKVLTMFMFLIENGDRHFNDPIADHVPALLGAENAWNPIIPEWNEITIGDLAGEMAGLAGDFASSDLAPPQGLIGLLPPSIQKAFPQLPYNEVPKCGYVRPDGVYSTCSIDEYVAGVATQSPIFTTAYTPVYSNEAFVLVGLALADISNKEPQAIFQDVLVERLGLTGTSYTVPSITPKTALIPGDALESGWNTHFGVFGPTGGYFSTTNDLATIGKAILNSTLLSRAQTNRWLKPSGFVESFEQGVGKPWEIYRQKVNGQSVDLYTKAGRYGSYITTFILVPQYNFGFTILTASDPGSLVGLTVRDEFPNDILNTMLPVLDAIAREQAISNFAGHYIDQRSNSSLTIITDPRTSGLIVSQWSSNGISLWNLLALITPNMVLRLQPNQINYGYNKIGFTSYYMSATPPTNRSQVYSFECDGWFAVDQLSYGNIPLGQLVFGIDMHGKSTSVELRALRTTLQRV